jgi:WD40 repeat protein
MTFSGHSGKIKGMAWSKEDNILVTCGADGIIMAYKVGMENCGSKMLYLHSTK